MKTIGILGGMSAVSTQFYYSRLCRMVRDRMGGLHSPDLVIRSVNFEEIAALQRAGRWDLAGERLNREASLLERAGASVILLATNTMHLVAGPMMEGVGIPLLHIADATASAIAARGLKRPGLIATAFTMEGSFYTDRLVAGGLDPLVPDGAARAEVNRIIFEELCVDEVRPASRACYERVAADLVARGADSLILGCTEVSMLLSADTVSVPVFDTTQIHCEAALAFALG